MIQKIKSLLTKVVTTEYVDKYDRMNPDERLFELLAEYAEIGYGRKPYGLSTAEAKYIVERVQNKGVW